MNTCPLCEKSFSLTQNLNRHMRAHTVMHKCNSCLKEFTRNDNLKRHMIICGRKMEKKRVAENSQPSTSMNCSSCHRRFTRRDELLSHEKVCLKKQLVCTKCNKHFSKSKILKAHVKQCYKPGDLRANRSRSARSQFPSEDGIITMASAFNGNIVTYFIENVENSSDIHVFLAQAVEQMKSKIELHLVKWPGVAVNFSLDTQYEHPVTQLQADRNFKTRNVPIYQMTDIDQVLHDGLDKIGKEIEEYEGKGSGYSLKTIRGLVLNISKHNPLKAGCYIPLPEWIRKTQSCDTTIYPTTEDCFKRAILAKTPPTGISYDFSCISCPTQLNEIKKFQLCNKLAINIFALDEEDKLYPFAVCDEKYIEYVDLLLLNSENHNHFIRIFNFEKLIVKQLTTREHSIAVCKRCFTYFDDQSGAKEARLWLHQENCIGSPTRAKMPERHEKIYFSNQKHQLRVPFAVYCDIESLLVPIASCEPPVVDPVTQTPRSYTNKIQEHQILSYGLYVSSDIHEMGEDDFNIVKTYTGEDAATRLFEELISIGEKVMWFYAKNTPVDMSPQDIVSHASASECYLCQQCFTPADCKVIDHNHITGQYRGASHQSCNLKASQPKFLPIFFHNGSGYDFKYLARELGKFPGEIKVIANTEEKYISFQKKVERNFRYIWLRFLDSCRFLPSSLDSIVKTLKPEQFTILPKIYRGRQLELLLEKGQMPYEYMSDWHKLNDTALPLKEKFYSSLTESGISDEEYQHAIDVWNEFGVKTLGEYSDLYLKTDVYLLAEVYENFRKEFLRSEYGLDPVNYFSIPGLAFDGMLKITKVSLDHLSDIDMLLMVERGIRGGFTQVTLRHAMQDTEHQLCYIDANNLYGYGSCQNLPMSEFKWVDPSKVNLLAISDNAEIGYIAEVDIDIPQHLHDYFNELPPLPEKLKIDGSKYTKLVATLNPKQKYVLHYKLLQFVVAHGCILKAVHRVISFQQRNWLTRFIDVNTEKRKVAESDFEKDLWKLLNNANFGKTIESVRKRMDLRLVNKWKTAEKLIKKPNFLSRTILGENLVSIHMQKTEIEFNKPIFVGFTILEMAKLKMLSFHYDVMMKHYGPERLKLTYTDTDSFVYLIKTFGQDWRIEVFNHMLDHFDFSNLPESHPCFSLNNKKVLAKFKDELAGKDLIEWVGLRAKMYSIKLSEQMDIKKAKGIKKSAVKKKITFEDYKRVLFQDEVMTTKFTVIRSYALKLFTVTLNKLSLTSKDDKRHILPNKISTLAHGHFAIMEDGDEVE